MAAQLAVETRAGGEKQPLSITWNALAVMAGKTLTMGLGFLFWLVAAHEFSRPDVGIAAAAVSAMMLCTQLAIGGVGSAVITCFPEFRARPAALLDTSGTFVIGSAILAAGVFFVIAAFGLRHLDTVASDPLYAIAFVATTVFGTLSILLDEISISLGRGDQVLVRGVVFGAATLAGIGILPMLFPDAGSAAIFAPWALAGAVNVGLGVFQLRGMVPGYRFRPRIVRGMRRLLLRHGTPNYALTLAERAPGLVMPIVVTQVLTPADNSTWYAVWMMAWVVYTLPISAGLTLFAEASNRPTQLAQATRAAVRVALLVGLVSSLLIGALAHFALSLLGSAYGATGAGPLRILLLAFVPITFVQAYFAGSRARRQLREAVATGWISASVSVVAGAAGAVVGGLEGIAYAWLAVQTATAAWAVARTASFWRNPLDGARETFEVIAARTTHIAVRTRTGAASAAVAVGRANLAAAGGAGLALLIWALSIRHVALEHMNGLGLVSVLHTSFYVAVAVLMLTFLGALLRRDVSERTLLGLVVVLIFMLFGLTPILEAVPRFAVTWRHVGITQAILDTGHVNPHFDAYFNWPGFFVFMAALTRAAGLHDALPLTSWSPIYFNLAYLVPLFVIARSLTASRRLIWLSIWLFYLGNWIGQDYFSPQGFTYFLFLVVVALLLRYFVPQPAEPTMQSPFLLRRARGIVTKPQPLDAPAARPAPQRWMLSAVILFLFVALVPTHQLTPIAVLFAVTVVAILEARRSLWWLPPLMVALLGGWYATGAKEFLKGHLAKMLGEAGKLDAAFSQNVANRVGGDFGHRVVADTTILAGAAMWSLAFLGAMRLLRRDSRYRVPLALALVPVAMVAAQSYGGEMLLRVELFALPFTAFFAAAALVGDDDEIGLPTRRAAMIGGVLLLFSALFLVARYGNERMDYFTHDETTAVQHLYALAKPGSTLVAGVDNLPWKYTQYEAHHYRLIVDMPHWSATAPATASQRPLLRDVRQAMTGNPRSYLIIDRSQEYAVDQLGYGRPGSLNRFAHAVTVSPDFKVVYRNPQATIFTLTRAGRLRVLQTAASGQSTSKFARTKRR